MEPTQPQDRYVPTDAEVAIAEELDARARDLRGIQINLESALWTLASAVNGLTVLGVDLAREALTLTSKQATDGVIGWAGTLLEEVNIAQIGRLKASAESCERMATTFERMAAIVREYGRCPNCKSFHPPMDAHVIALRDHLQGKGEGFFDLFRQGNDPSHN